MRTKPIKITDLNGFELEIDDLQLAIMQADDYRHYQHSDPQFQATDDRLKNYWDDVYQKLIEFKT
jgi:hypothetical protein